MESDNTLNINKKPFEWFACTFCPLKFTSSHSLSRHVSSCHSGSKKVSCHYCNKLFDTKLLLDLHIKNKHAIDNIYCCPKKSCDLTFSSVKQYNAHVLTHKKDDSKVFKCKTCSKCYFKEQQYLCHTKKHEKSTDLTCNICLLKLNDKEMLKKHSKLHSSLISCQYCTHKFGGIHSLMSHVDLEHKEENKYKEQKIDEISSEASSGLLDKSHTVTQVTTSSSNYDEISSEATPGMLDTSHTQLTTSSSNYNEISSEPTPGLLNTVNFQLCEVSRDPKKNMTS